MEAYKRTYPRFSACGLNCGLCPRYHTEGSSRCPGCCGEDFFEKHPSCGVVSCIRTKEGKEYCCMCDEYPCKKYDNAEWDSFITHKKMTEDFAKLKAVGIDAYKEELDEKVEILEWLLLHFNDGRRKNFYCIAVNLLELDTVREIVRDIKRDTETALSELSLKEKTAAAVNKFQSAADERNIVLKLNKKKK